MHVVAIDSKNPPKKKKKKNPTTLAQREIEN